MEASERAALGGRVSELMSKSWLILWLLSTYQGFWINAQNDKINASKQIIWTHLLKSVEPTLNPLLYPEKKKMSKLSFRMFVYVFVLEHVYSYVCLSLWPNTSVSFCFFVIVCYFNVVPKHFYFSRVDWLIEEFIKLQIPLLAKNSSIFHLSQLSFFLRLIFTRIVR